jgi:phage terminase Nu1 subunit (DNA packaging protein)
LARKDSEKNTYTVSTAEISEIFGISTRRVQQLAKDGVFVRVGHGQFDLPASVNSFIEYRLDDTKDEGVLDKTTEEAKWTRARREKTELELQIMRGDLHRSEDVRRVMNDMMGAFRARILSIPSKFAPQLVGLTEIPPIKEVLKQGVYEALEELSDYDPMVFYDISKDKMLLEDADEVTSIDDELNGEPVRHDGKPKK